MELSDFFLVKCFAKHGYRDTFNGGKIYLGHVKNYWEIENAFQQDNEGMILRHEGEGYLIVGNPEFNQLMKHATLFSEIKGFAEEHGLTLGQTNDFTAWIGGYICCFYLLAKKDVFFHDNRMFFQNEKAKKHFEEFIVNYLKDNGNAYCSIYDAAILCKSFAYACSVQGYGFALGPVIYRELDFAQKSIFFNQGRIGEIVFSKPEKFSYQREYRFFVSLKADSKKDHIFIDEVNVNPCMVATFEFKDSKR